MSAASFTLNCASGCVHYHAFVQILHSAAHIPMYYEWLMARIRVVTHVGAHVLLL